MSISDYMISRDNVSKSEVLDEINSISSKYNEQLVKDYFML
jgi:hypothetical protein